MKPNITITVSLAVMLGITSVGRAELIGVFASSFPGGNPILETVSLSTGNINLRGTINWGGTVNDIAEDPKSGTLYGLLGADLFAISTTGNIGTGTPVAAAGMNGSMETLAFNSNGDIYLGTQSQDTRRAVIKQRGLHSLTDISTVKQRNSDNGIPAFDV